MSSVEGRLAGAPISWGVCEVPGWGVMLPPERVLGDMRRLGLAATELGPVGYLGSDGAAIGTLLAGYSLQAVGGFVPLVLHDAAQRRQALADAEHAAGLLSGSGASRFITALVVDARWSEPFDLDTAQWRTVAEGLDAVDEVCAEHELTQVLHPHVGTLVETGEQLSAALEHSPVRLCLDTGHLAIGGVDPARVAADLGGRIAHVHLKDADPALAAAVHRRETTLLDAAQAGLFRPLGEGAVDVAGAITALERSGYDGWYVFEQDITIDEDDADDAHPEEGVLTSMRFVEQLVAGLG